ncbi:MAG: metal-dependent hydrolase [Patescibacteria group bacterium]|nr:metal-dependent hydrolase [Patescibacteria group bacterium]
MVLPGHLAGGYIVTRALLAWTHAAFSSAQNTALLVIGTIAGELPDIDLAWFYLTNVVNGGSDKDNHRDHVTHAPLFWLTLSLTIVVIGYIIKDIFVQYIGWSVLVGTWSHFILDSIEYGIRWLWPFSNRRFCLREISDVGITATRGSLSYYWQFVTGHYPRRITFYAEILVVCIALAVFFYY